MVSPVFVDEVFEVEAAEEMCEEDHLVAPEAEAGDEGKEDAEGDKEA